MAASARKKVSGSAMLIFLVAILLCSKLQAQSVSTAPGVDHKQEGAPMPPLIFMSYNDTATSIDRSLIPKKYPGNIYRTRTDTSGRYTYMTANDLGKSANLIVIIFNPLCSHCEEVSFSIEKNIRDFKDTKVVLLANTVMGVYLPDFEFYHHISKYPNMYIGLDSSKFIDNMFLYQPLPQLNIYNADRKLVKIFTGDIPIDTIKRYINYSNGPKRKKKV